MVRFCGWLLGLACCCSTVVAADHWSQFRGPGGNATAPGAKTPRRWSVDQNLRWRTKLVGRGASSPVAWGDRVYVTAYSGYGIDIKEPGDTKDLRFHVLAISAETGAIEWNRESKAGNKVQPCTPRIGDHGYASNTPACDESGVYAFFGSSGVIAYDPSGGLKWRADVGSGTAGFGTASSPVLYGDLLIVNASIESQRVIAFDKHTGQVAWELNDVVRSWTTPAIVKTEKGDAELVISYREEVRGVDPETGKPLWRCDGIQDYVVPCVVSHSGIAYVLGGRKNQAIAIRTGGRGDVTETHTVWSKTIGANVTSPLYYQGRLYWASDKGIACCLDAKTGETVYRRRLPTRSRIYASMIQANEWLYVTTRDKGVVVLPAKPEFEELNQNVFAGDESLLNASPIVIGDRMIWRSDEFLYCVGAE